MKTVFWALTSAPVLISRTVARTMPLPEAEGRGGGSGMCQMDEVGG